MDQAATYFLFANRFGWTPEQVDSSPAVIIDRLQVIAQLWDEHQASQQRSAGEVGGGVSGRRR